MAKFLTLLLSIGLALGQKPIKIILVGDSTVNDEGGWGEGFRAALGPPVEVINLVDYVAEVRKIAAGKNVPLIDLYALTLAQSETLGPEGSKTLGATTKDGKLDTTHLSATGRQEIGVIAAREFVRLEPALKPYWRH